jgi:hypothetical protein
MENYLKSRSTMRSVVFGVTVTRTNSPLLPTYCRPWEDPRCYVEPASTQATADQVPYWHGQPTSELRDCGASANCPCLPIDLLNGEPYAPILLRAVRDSTTILHVHDSPAECRDDQH